MKTASYSGSLGFKSLSVVQLLGRALLHDFILPSRELLAAPVNIP